jgi:hypothetical protein
MAPRFPSASLLIVLCAMDKDGFSRFISASVRTESHYAGAAALPKIKASRAASFKIFRPLQRSE